MSKFEQDVLHWREYDYVVINDNLDMCYNEILNVIKKKINNNKFFYEINKIEAHIKSLIQ